MFLTLMFGMLVTFNESVSAQKCVPNDDQIAVFVGEEFSGECKVLGQGNITTPPFTWVNSIKVGKNMNANLCRYTGQVPEYACRSFGSDTTSVDLIFNLDKNSSITRKLSQIVSYTKLQFLESIEVRDYEFRWSDKGSGHSKDMSFWHPKTPPGYFVLGSFGNDSWDAPKGVTYAYKPILRAFRDGVEYDVMVHPTDYKQEWNDQRTGAEKDGSIWMPICPENYKYIAYVAQAGHGKPSTNDGTCIFDSLSLLAGRKRKLTYKWDSSKVSTTFRNWAWNRWYTLFTMDLESRGNLGYLGFLPPYIVNFTYYDPIEDGDGINPLTVISK